MFTAMMVTIKNSIIDLTNKGVGVRQLFLSWASWARWIGYNIDIQKTTNAVNL